MSTIRTHFSAKCISAPGSKYPDLYRLAASMAGIEVDLVVHTDHVPYNALMSEVPLMHKNRTDQLVLGFPHTEQTEPHTNVLQVASILTGCSNVLTRLPDGSIEGQDTRMMATLLHLKDIARERGVNWFGKKALVVGRGSSALAAAHACRLLRLVVTVANRYANGFDQHGFPGIMTTTDPGSYDVVIHTGEVDERGQTTFPATFHRPAIAVEMLYQPRIATQFVQDAMKAGSVVYTAERPTAYKVMGAVSALCGANLPLKDYVAEAKKFFA